jgi:hypothetical protein
MAEHAGLRGFLQLDRHTPDQEERVDLFFDVPAFGAFGQFAAGHAAGDLLIHFVRSLASEDLHFGINGVRVASDVVVRIADLKVDRFPQHHSLDLLLIGTIEDVGDASADDFHILDALDIGGLVGGVSVGIGDTYRISAAEFEVPLPGVAGPSVVVTAPRAIRALRPDRSQSTVSTSPVLVAQRIFT